MIEKLAEIIGLGRRDKMIEINQTESQLERLFQCLWHEEKLFQYFELVTGLSDDKSGRHLLSISILYPCQDFVDIKTD